MDPEMGLKMGPASEIGPKWSGNGSGIRIRPKMGPKMDPEPEIGPEMDPGSEMGPKLIRKRVWKWFQNQKPVKMDPEMGPESEIGPGMDPEMDPESEFGPEMDPESGMDPKCIKKV